MRGIVNKTAARRVDKRVLAAQFAALCAVSSPLLAAVVDSGPVSIAVPQTTAGIYLNVITGVSATAPAGAPGWDINPWGSTALNFFGGATSGSYIAAGGNVVPQNIGDVVGPASTFATSAGTVGTSFRNSGTSILGFRFFNEGNGNSVHYGYAEITTTAPNGIPATIVRYVYESTPDTPITVAGAVMNTPPQFAYNPASGSPVNFTGGGLVGSSGNGSVAVSVGTAGAGTGAAATTTLTCTAPTAPFSGFGQTVTAVGAGAISGGPLSGTCVLGATQVTQTLTCSENRGGTPTAVSFTLTCPAGTQPPLTSTPVSGSTISLGTRSFGGAATTAPLAFQNPGSLAATVTCSAPSSPAFSVAPTSFSVPAGGSASTVISYSSTVLGVSTATLQCSANGQLFDFNLTGSTIQPPPAFIPSGSAWSAALMIGLFGLFAGLFVYRRQG